MNIDQASERACVEENDPKIVFSERCLPIPEILEKIFMYSSLSGMGSLSQVNRNINQTAKTLQNKEAYPKIYQKILLQVFAHLFKKPVGEITSHFIFLHEKNKISELELLIDSPEFHEIDLGSFKMILQKVIPTGHEQLAEILINSAKFNEIDLGFFDNIFLQATRKGYEQVINKLISSSRFKEVSERSLAVFLYQAISGGYEQVTKNLINSPKFNEMDISSFSSVLLQVTSKGYEQIVKALITSPKFGQIDLDSLGKFLKESAEKGYMQIVKKILDSSRFEGIDGRDLGAALYQATLHKHEELAMKLLNVCHSKERIPADAVYYLANDWGEAFKYAAQNGLDKFIHRFIALGTPFSKIILNQLAGSLILASRHGHLKVVEEIIDSSRFHEVTQDDLNQAYQEALSEKHEQLAQILKEFTDWRARMCH